MSTKIDYHKENRACEETEDGVTLLEEAVILAYTSNKETMGRKALSVISAGYSSNIDDLTPTHIVERIATTIFNKKQVRKRIEDIMKDREGSFVYDKVFVQEKAMKLLSMAEKDKNLPVMKNTLEMMMKNLGMLNNVDAGTSAVRGSSKRAKAAFDKRKKLNLAEFPKKEKGKQG